MKVTLSEKDRALLQKLFKELVTFEYQKKLSPEESIHLGNLAHKLGLFVG